MNIRRHKNPRITPPFPLPVPRHRFPDLMESIHARAPRPRATSARQRHAHSGTAFRGPVEHVSLGLNGSLGRLETTDEAAATDPFQ